MTDWTDSEVSGIVFEHCYSARGHGGSVHLIVVSPRELARTGKTACGRIAGELAVPMGGTGWCPDCKPSADELEARIIVARRLAETPHGLPCRCGCGFSTRQRNGYVRLHTPKRGRS